MSEIFYTGFGGTSNATLETRFPGTSGGGGYDISAAHGRFGQGLQLVGTKTLPIPIPGSPSAVFVGLAHKPTSSGTYQVAQIRGATGNHISLWHNGALWCYELRGPNNITVLASTPNASTTINIYRSVKFGLLALSDSVGAAELRLEGAAYAATAVDTKGADATITGADLTCGSGNSYHADDVYVNDGAGSAPHNTFYDDIRIDDEPLGADSVTDFARSAGATNKSNVDDGNTPDGDTTYNHDNVVGQKDKFTLAGTVGAGTILGMVVRVMARKDDAGVRGLKASLTVGATEALSAEKMLSLTYEEVSLYAPENVDTLAAWAGASEVNAALVGYELTT